jgi:hypothetical protein
VWCKFNIATYQHIELIVKGGQVRTSSSGLKTMHMSGSFAHIACHMAQRVGGGLKGHWTPTGHGKQEPHGLKSQFPHPGPAPMRLKECRNGRQGDIIPLESNASPAFPGGES